MTNRKSSSKEHAVDAARKRIKSNRIESSNIQDIARSVVAGNREDLAKAITLIESELFGHVKGSFTGANKDRAGKFEAANRGTIFLDEIGDMSLSAQAKVLRALQESRISRVGSDKDIKIDVRVVAATNKNLKEEIGAGRFREDLYHRLAVILIKVPALNERREDIPLLVDFFSKKISCIVN